MDGHPLERVAIEVEVGGRSIEVGGDAADDPVVDPDRDGGVGA